ncbi:MAG: glutamate synthase-related protein [Bacillota bacterium]
MQVREQAMDPRRIREYLRAWERHGSGLVAMVRKDGRADHGLVERLLSALAALAHRSGDVDGEGDGCGIQVDIPRALWAEALAGAGRPPELAYDPRFAVGHFFIPRSEASGSSGLKAKILRRMAAEGLAVLLDRTAPVDSSALGPRGRAEEPELWQVALLCPDGEAGESRLFSLGLAVEAETPVAVVSLSTQVAVYKVRGTPETLRRYYPELQDPRLATRAAIGHILFSTNVTGLFERAQPFHLLAHNGGISTVSRLREETLALGIPLTREGTDAQDLDRCLEGLIHRYGFTLMEAMEVVFPPILAEIRGLKPELQDLYLYLRQAWGPFAQGPAAVAARYRDEMVFAVDAMGLRPLWLLETEEEYVFASEQGVVPIAEVVRDPRPLAPGEKIGLLLREGGPPEFLSYPEVQDRVLGLCRQRLPALEGWRRYLSGTSQGMEPGSLPGLSLAAVPGSANTAGGEPPAFSGPSDRLLAALGWSAEDHQMVRALAQTGSEPIGSLGYDGPLAALAEERQNLADYFKESVAAVTCPAVDRDREVEHFSTRVLLGARPPLAVRGSGDVSLAHRTRVELQVPVILGGHAGPMPLDLGAYRQVAARHGTRLLEDLCREWDPVYGAGKDPGIVRVLPTAFQAPESLPAALERLGREAVAAVREGAELLILDDRECFQDGRLWIDPHLALAAVDRALREHPVPPEEPNLRRRCAVVLRSGAIRSLHDLALALGLGADAVNPYLMLEVAAQADPREGIGRLLEALTKGLEKVISTLGIYELRGYGRHFSSIGLRPEVARYFGCTNYCGSEDAGLGFDRLQADAEERYAVAGAGEGRARLGHTFRIWPKVWKAAGAAAADPGRYEAYAARLQAVERETPVSLRHLADLVEVGGVSPAEVDTRIEDYAYPITISGMSFGSQGETAFRAYAEAARRLDIVCMNGEGGEIPDLVGRYYKWRGQQVASGRFGVHAPMLAGSRFMEIKIGQGAKPGEGGHLPGKKVSLKVAAARNAVPGVDLISPSNNHDIYALEDLAQLIAELRAVNPDGKVVVKVAAVPGVGALAVGIAKAGADIIALCGYDGGTGAARKHALRHAGLPIEIGVREAHLALVEAGLRDRVELWADSGMRSGLDVIKMILLGANRVGFATLAMVAVGCTICRGCQLDTCHVGIATQIETVEEARERGLKLFVPRVYEEAVARLVTLFTSIGEEVRLLTARLGARRTQDLVGRVELLRQVRGLDRVDLSALLTPVPARAEAAPGEGRPLRRVAASRDRELVAVAAGHRREGQREVQVRLAGVEARERALGTPVAGELARQRLNGSGAGGPERVAIRLDEGAAAGSGLGAFNVDGVEITVQGGAQDGVGKCAAGGAVRILKTRNRFGQWVGGSVGKGFAYGAQRGLFLVQGDADARCCVRLSGADVVLGGRLRGPVDDGQGLIGTRANLKGFAFEYMTRGRVVVLGDPGPWICAGMTGGVVYVRLQPELGFDEAALRRRLAKSARVRITGIGSQGKKDLTELLGAYHQALLDSGQEEEAAEVLQLMLDCERCFVAIVPAGQQVDPTQVTE